MTDHDDENARISRLPGLVAVAFLLPFAYLASLGPFVWIAEHGRMPNDWADSTFETFYFPILYVDEHSEFFNEHPVGEAYADYVNWFD